MVDDGSNPPLQELFAQSEEKWAQDGGPDIAMGSPGNNTAFPCPVFLVFSTTTNESWKEISNRRILLKERCEPCGEPS